MQIRSEVSDATKKILQDAFEKKISMEEGAKSAGVPIDEFKEAVKVWRQHFDTSGYNANVQKMISFKGTVREMTLQATNRKGGKYPLKVINLYMKPNTERYYEEKAYPVDKNAIRKGSPSEGYHPDKASWSDFHQKRERVKKEKTPGFMGEEPIDIGRKKGSSIRRMKLRIRRCKCLRKRK